METNIQSYFEFIEGKDLGRTTKGCFLEGAGLQK